MRVANSLKSLRKRDKSCKLVVRSGVLFILNKLKPKFKAKQGCKKHPKFMPSSKRGF